METSLQKLIMEEKLKSTDIDSISKDVACVLVYLHSLVQRHHITVHVGISK